MDTRSCRRRLTLWILALLLAAAPRPGAAAQDGSGGTGSREAAATAPAKRIVINVPSRTLTLFEDGRPVASYPVAVGKPATPTPIGSFRIVVKLRDPVWWAPARQGGKPVPPGPNNPLGPVWLGLSKPGYGIHGTIAPSSIGRTISKGCIRLHNEHAEAVFAWARVGTPVEITYRLITVAADERGLLRVLVHPDVYGRGAPPVDEIARILAAAGIDPELAAARAPAVREAVRAARQTTRVTAAEPVSVRVDGRDLGSVGFEEGGRVYVPLRRIADALGHPVDWDAASEQALVDGQPVPDVVLAGRVYVPLRAAAELLGFAVTWEAEARAVSVASGQARMDGAP